MMMTERRDGHRRVSEMAGITENGAILPPTEAGIDRSSLPWWKTDQGAHISEVARPIETAPHDGTEIYLVSVQHDGNIISIHNGFWDGSGFTIGRPGFDSRVGDGCATHWIPKSAIRFASE